MSRVAVALIGRRLLTVAPVLLGVSLLTFFVVNTLPGSAAQQLLGVDASPRDVTQLEEQLGLDRPFWERYGSWLSSSLKGNLGFSIASNQSVTALIAERLPVTLELVGYGFVVALIGAVPLALIAARWPGGLTDRIANVVSIVALSVPNYAFALLLVLIAAVKLPMFPAIGFVPWHESALENIKSLTLPATAVALPLFGLYTRFLRGDLVEQIRREDYIVAAAAKGLGAWSVVIRHAFGNSVFGLLTIVGLNFGALIGGTVIIEEIFALPGLGQLLLQAIGTRDATIVQGIVLLLALMTVLSTLAVDVTYTLLDPRIRYASD